MIRSLGVRGAAAEHDRYADGELMTEVFITVALMMSAGFSSVDSIAAPRSECLKMFVSPDTVRVASGRAFEVLIHLENCGDRATMIPRDITPLIGWTHALLRGPGGETWCVGIDMFDSPVAEEAMGEKLLLTPHHIREQYAAMQAPEIKGKWSMEIRMVPPTRPTSAGMFRKFVSAPMVILEVE